MQLWKEVNNMTMKVDPSVKWSGPTRPYDLIKELAVAVLVIGLLAGGLSFLFSSPDEKAVTLKSWAQTNPVDFAQTATGELAGTTTSASYGPPYNKAASGQHFGILKLQDWSGVRIPINPAKSFVLDPLASYNDVAGQDAVVAWNAATANQQTAWATAYADALGKATDATAVADPSNLYGPVPTLITSLLNMAKGGALDAALLSQGGFFQTDNTKQILFFGDGSYLDDAGTAANLQGGTWGMMNETGRYPGQAWLWLYSFWYQIPPFNNEESKPIGANADVYIMLIMGVMSAGLIFIPFIPGVKNLPMRIPIQRGIWRQYYQANGIKRRRK